MSRMERRKILIADDEALFLSSLKDHLQLAHPELEVETAANGVQALRILDAGGIDLVATDVQMPQLDGLELLASVVTAGLKIPVIVFSAFADAPLREQADSFGAVAVFDKPVDLDRLSEAIQQALNKSSGGEINGISVAGFLQLLQMEKKSCRVHVRSGKREADLFFDEGELVHALWEGLEGHQAGQEVVRWDPAEIKMEGNRWRRPRTVDMSLAHLLLASAKEEDERDEGSFGDTETPLREPDSWGVPLEMSAPESSTVEPVAEDGMMEVLADLQLARGFLGAALLRSEDHRSWTLGPIPEADLKEALEHCAFALETKEELLKGFGIETESGWDLAITLPRHFYLARRIGSGGALLVVLSRDVASLANAMREVADLCERLEPHFLLKGPPPQLSSLRAEPDVGLHIGEAF